MTTGDVVNLLMLKIAKSFSKRRDLRIAYDKMWEEGGDEQEKLFDELSCIIEDFVEERNNESYLSEY